MVSPSYCSTALGDKRYKRAVEPLICTLKDASWMVRKQVAKSIIRIGEPAVESLIKALHNQNYYVRYYAIEPLEKTLKDKSRNIRRITAKVLARIKKNKKSRRITNKGYKR